MKRQMSFIFAVLIVSMLISCANPATSTTASPTVSPTAPNPPLLPGEVIGEMILAKDETGEPDIFNHCSPFVVESDPQAMIRTCNVPQSPHIFIGYGEMASSIEELDSLWSTETWQLGLPPKN